MASAISHCVSLERLNYNQNQSGRCLSAAKQVPHRPGLAPVRGLRAGSNGSSMITQTGLARNRSDYLAAQPSIFSALAN
jgi:hypothetical protein